MPERPFETITRGSTEMAMALVISYQDAARAEALPPRRAVAVSASEPTWRVPPRVYTPFPARRLSRPMAVPAVAEDGRDGTGRRSRPPLRLRVR